MTSWMRSRRKAFSGSITRRGVFVKGNFGVGNIDRGDLIDEDFPPAVVPYSNTLSEIKDSRMRFGSLDAGYNFLNWENGKLGAFAGYRYFYERINGFGCRQNATSGILRPCGTHTVRCPV